MDKPGSDSHWELDIVPQEFISLFKISEAHTTITHIEENHKSIYFINKYYYNEVNKRIELDLTSDTGDNYTGIIDDINENIRLIYKEEGTFKLVIFSFKRFWQSKSEN